MSADFKWLETTWSSPVMLVILLCSVVTLGFIIERWIYFWKRRGDADTLLTRVRESLRSGDRKGAAWACAREAHPMGPVTATVLENAGQPADAVEEKLQIALSEQRLLLERNLGVLGTVGSIAPLIGLLGTVWGIMRAFSDMARTGSAGPSVVAAGVAEALLTTAAGLIVAVPAVVLYNHFVRRTHVLLTEAENHARGVRLEIERSEGGAESARRAA